MSPRPVPLPTLEHYTGFVRRHFWLLATAVAAGAVAGLVWALLQPRVYEAKASIALQPIPSYVSVETSREPPEVTIDTDAQLFRSPVVVSSVARATGRPVEEVPDVVVVTATPLSRVLHVRVVAGSPQRAAAGANAAATAFIQARREYAGALAEDQVIELAGRITELRDRLGARANRPQVGADVDTAATDLRILEQRFLELQRARAVPAEVIRRAVEPPAPEPRTYSVPATTSAMSGLLLAVLVGIALDQRSSRRSAGTAAGIAAGGPAPRGAEVGSR